MSGIAGWYDKQRDLREEEKQIDKIKRAIVAHPLAKKGQYVSAEVALLQSVAGTQEPIPLELHMGKAHFVLSFTGRLYNSGELRCELLKAGVSVVSADDTELVLKAYALWGESCVNHFNGVFALAVYEANSDKLFLARDRIGVKNLYYAQGKGNLLFGSDIGCILASGQIKPVVERTGLNELFMLGPAKTMGNAIYKDIKEIPMGHYMVYQNGKLTLTAYWRLRAKTHEEDLDTTTEHTAYLLKDSIERQMVGGAPVCTFLSGGLDSSLISRIAADTYHRQGERLDTYSVDYVDNDKYFESSLFQPNADSDYIAVMQQAIGSRHHGVVLDNIELATALDDAVLARGLPGMADVDSSLLLFCREVKQQQNIALSGECADELFGGYPWYHNRDSLFDDTFPWSRSTTLRHSILREGLLPDGDEYVHSAYQDTIAMTDTLPGEKAVDKRMREMYMLNLYWFMQTLLLRSSAMSNECDLEIRVPFCDYRIVEYAYNMPWEFKALDGREKGILRKGAQALLPAETVWRKKSPFPKTYSPLYFASVCAGVKAMFAEKDNPLNDLLNVPQLLQLMEHPEGIATPWYGQLMKTPQIMAYLLQINTWIKTNHIELAL